MYLLYNFINTIYLYIYILYISESTLTGVSNGASIISIKLLNPSSGSSTIAALTAFLQMDKMLVFSRFLLYKYVLYSMYKYVF